MTDWPCDLGEPLVEARHQYALGTLEANDPTQDLVSPLQAWVKRSGGADWKYLSRASKLDRIIWDMIVVRRELERHCDALTLLTSDIEFDVLIFRDRSRTLSSKVTYFPVTTSSQKVKDDLKYWGEVLDSEQFDKVKGLGEWIDEVVVWNCYELTGVQKGTLVTADGSAAPHIYGEFRRTNFLFRDRARRLFVNVPVPSKVIFQSGELQHEPSDAEQSKVVALLCKGLQGNADWVTAVGSPMVRNLESLSALLLDDSRRVTLVTGFPGTGKEAYARALHFADQLFEGHDSARFVTTTALELASDKVGPVNSLREKVSKVRNEKTQSIAIFIDELNKANKPEMHAELLRVLEDPNRELNLGESRARVNFVLAASEHIDELTKRQSPQDFWTRISHQLRVVHPLAFVSEDDAAKFLRGYFFYEWWRLVRAAVKEDPRAVVGEHLRPKRPQEDFVAMMFGKEADGELKPSVLCDRILHELLASLVPLVTRDSLSVRGVRSIVGQVFARVLSQARYASEEGESREGKLALAIAVNRAVQDVLAVLNAARVVPRNGSLGQ